MTRERFAVFSLVPRVEIEEQGDEAIMRVSGVGMRGPSGAGASIHEEGFTDLDTWIVNHNFGRKPTATSILSPGGVEQMADVVHVTDNQLRVLFAQPYTGFVRVM